LTRQNAWIIIQTMRSTSISLVIRLLALLGRAPAAALLRRLPGCLLLGLTIMGCCFGKGDERPQGTEFEPVVPAKGRGPGGGGVAGSHSSSRPSSSLSPDGRRLTVPCEPSHVGGVIGSHGATIKRLEAESGGAQLHVDQTRQDRPEIVVTGTPVQVRKAGGLIEALLEQLEHPDYEGEAGHKHRLEAEKWGQRADTLFKQSKAAYAAHEGKRAKELSTEAHAAVTRRDEANAAAAAAIFRSRNPRGGKAMRCDLHGLHKDEALAALERYFGEIGADATRPTRVTIVIPGAGHHSSGHRAVLKPAVEQWLRARHFEFKSHDSSGGSLEVRV
jgi:DNA-nicking Smr family endonuclease